MGIDKLSGAANPATNSLYEEPWWLDAVSPGEWHSVQVERGGEVVARMPFVVRERFGLRLVGMPRLTQQLGPWIRSPGGKRSAVIGWQIEMIEALLCQLPKNDIVRLSLFHGLETWLPYYWAGFSATVSYTYQVKNLTDLEKVWSEFDGSVRTDVRKAQRKLVVRDDLGIEEFIRLNSLTFQRQGISKSYDDDAVRRLDEACSARNARRLLFAQDAAGRVHAAIFVVWDSRAAYYLLGGSDPELRGSAAMTLLLWHAIQHAATVTSVFDFEGSMLRPVERFVRTFGTTAVPYYTVTKFSRRYTAVDAALSLARQLRLQLPGR